MGLKSISDDHLAYLLDSTQAAIIKTTERLEAKAGRLPPHAITGMARSINARRALLQALKSEHARRVLLAGTA